MAGRARRAHFPRTEKDSGLTPHSNSGLGDFPSTADAIAVKAAPGLQPILPRVDGPTRVRVLTHLQRSVGNTSVNRLMRVVDTGSPPRPRLSEADSAAMHNDVEQIVDFLRGSMTPTDQRLIVSIIDKWSDRDDEYREHSGYTGTFYLDHFLLQLKMRSYSYTSFLIEHHALAFDELWRKMEDERLDEFKKLVARSKGQATTGPELPAEEGLLSYIGKREALGFWGVLKGMGTTLSGVVDTAIWAYWKTSGLPLKVVLEQRGVKVDDYRLTPFLEKKFDESARIIADGLGVDVNEELFHGISVYQFGTGGGKVVGGLTLAGGAGQLAEAGAATDASEAAQAGRLGSQVFGATQAAQGIGQLKARLDQLRKAGLSWSEIAKRPDVWAQVVGTIAGAVSGAGGFAAAGSALAKTAQNLGIALNAGQVPLLVSAFQAVDSDPTLKSPEARGERKAELLASVVSAGALAIDGRYGKSFQEAWKERFAEGTGAGSEEKQEKQEQREEENSEWREDESRLRAIQNDPEKLLDFCRELGIKGVRALRGRVSEELLDRIDAARVEMVKKSWAKAWDQTPEEIRKWLPPRDHPPYVGTGPTSDGYKRIGGDIDLTVQLAEAADLPPATRLRAELMVRHLFEGALGDHSSAPGRDFDVNTYTPPSRMELSTPRGEARIQRYERLMDFYEARLGFGEDQAAWENLKESVVTQARARGSEAAAQAKSFLEMAETRYANYRKQIEEKQAGLDGGTTGDRAEEQARTALRRDREANMSSFLKEKGDLLTMPGPVGDQARAEYNILQLELRAVAPEAYISDPAARWGAAGSKEKMGQVADSLSASQLARARASQARYILEWLENLPAKPLALAETIWKASKYETRGGEFQRRELGIGADEHVMTAAEWVRTAKSPEELLAMWARSTGSEAAAQQEMIAFANYLRAKTEQDLADYLAAPIPSPKQIE